MTDIQRPHVMTAIAVDAAWQKEAAAAAGAMLVGLRTVEVGERMEANNDRGTESRDEGYPLLRTHLRPHPLPAAPTGTGCTAAAAATPTAPCGASPLSACTATSPPRTTSPDAPPKARPRRRSYAASSATSLARSFLAC
jgi:hypothetical protein